MWPRQAQHGFVGIVKNLRALVKAISRTPRTVS
jgi:hypothetical protein